MPKCLNNFLTYTSEYCTNTSIHGLKFLGERRRSIFERLFWLVILATFLFLCVMMILEAYHKWETSPVVVSFATSETPVWKIPFPAVTICPDVKTEKEMVNFTDLVLMKKEGKKLNANQTRQYNYMLEVCNWEDENGEKYDYLTEDFYDFILKVQPKFSDTIDECVWMGLDCMEDIKNMFSPIITQDGLCFTFNLLDRSDIFTKIVAQNHYDRSNISHKPSSNWSLDNGFDMNFGDNVLPRRTTIGGLNGGLDLTFWAESANLDYFCSDALQGYKVALHSPTQIPLVLHEYFRIGLNQVATVSVKPVVVKTSNQLKNYHPNQRHCYFAEERHLLFFKVYDQANCLQECVTNFTFQHCKCVTFDMPRLNTTPICGYGRRKCVQESLNLFVSLEDSKFDNDDSPDALEKCDCKQTCSSLGFETEVSQVDWKWRRRAKVLADESQLSSKNEYTRLRIFFKDLQFITSERNELYGLMDFLSSCGGLLGLFIGFSFVSCVEIIYFLTLRLLCNCRIFGRLNWAGDCNL